MEIKRDYYLNKLITKKNNGLIKVITGMRRCGKSYLLFYIFKKHLLENGVAAEHIIEIAFDSYENKKLRDPLLKGEENPVLLPPFSCHSLRHTFTTRLCESGINVKVI